MYCTHCGAPNADAATFCSNCGRSTTLYRLSFHGDGGTLFWIVFKNFLLTIVTLGVYSFWARIEKRRYLYSQVELDGDRFQFHGTGLELLLGWLKAIGLIAALFAQMFVWQFLLPDGAGTVLGAIILYLGVIAIVPLAIVGAWRYRASRSSYRGIRFSFRGSLGEAYGVYLKGVLLMLVTLGFYLPFFAANLRRYLTNNTWYGSEKFTFDGEGSDLFLNFIVCLLLTLPTLWLSQLWFLSKQQIYFLGRTTISSARFRFNATPASMMLTLLGTYLLQFVTLNIAMPWATVMRMQFFCDNMALEGAIDFARVQQRVMAASATGESLTDFLNTDIGLGM